MPKKFFLAAVLLLYFFCLGAGAAEDSPAIVNTFPPSGAQDVDPNLKELTVTFSKKMKQDSWAWVHEKIDTFPVIFGNTFFDSLRTTAKVPVHLHPNTEYVVWVNTDKFKKFKDEKGHPLPPFRWTFKTRY